MSNKTKVLFVSQEIFPFLPESPIASQARFLPQAVHESGKETRIFMPRYGKINERRHQLHEVIRLSGM
ncbi:MAG: glycogen/starch synthase, partial [Flavobacteriales bacterium]